VSWKPTRLADVSEVITKGTTPTTLGYDFTDAGVSFLRVQNIGGGNVNFERDTLFIDERTHGALARSQIKPGDVLVSIAGTIGRAAVVPEGAPPLNCNQAVAIVRPAPQVFRSYLRLWLEGADAQRQMRTATVTGTISNLSLSQVGNLEIPLPPMSEQRRIAKVLDRAEALRTKRRAALAQLDLLTQLIFLDLFGDPATNPKDWPLVQLGEHTKKIGSGSTPTGGETAYRAEGISLIRSLNVRDGEFTFKDLAHIGEEQAAKLSGVVVEENDVLLNITGASVARVCRAPASVLPARVNQHVCIIRPKPTLNAVFLEQFLLAEQTKRRLLKIGGAGATREAITKAQIEVFEATCPPIVLQQEFARRATAVEALKTAQRASLAELDALFATLQHRAFRGEL
jgi:type I restriction enzyme S subunit